MKVSQMTLFYITCVYICVYICMCIYIDFNIYLRKLMNGCHIISSLFVSDQHLVSGFLEFHLQLTIREDYYNSYVLFETPPETSFQFKFYSYCLSLLKVIYPIQVWLCYTRGTLVTQLVVKTATMQILPLFVYLKITYPEDSVVFIIAYSIVFIKYIM